MRQQQLILIIFFIPAFLFFGCTNTLNINITEIGNYPQPLIEPLPINVGVYYGNDFRTYKTIQENYPGDAWARISKIQLGGANIALFDYILSHIFKNVTSIQHFPIELESSKNIDLILKPTIFDYIYSERNSADYVNIKYRINFYSPDGLQIRPWSISGESSRYSTLHGVEISSAHSYCVELTQLAMREVAAQFFTDFCNQSDIKQLFNKQCNQ